MKLFEERYKYSTPDSTEISMLTKIRDEKLVVEKKKKSKTIATILINGPEIKELHCDHKGKNGYYSYCDSQKNTHQTNIYSLISSTCEYIILNDQSELTWQRN